MNVCGPPCTYVEWTKIAVGPFQWTSSRVRCLMVRLYGWMEVASSRGQLLYVKSFTVQFGS